MDEPKERDRLDDIIDEMGVIGHQLFPKVSENFFSSKFTKGIKESLRVHKCKNWSDIARQDHNTRKRILRGIMNSAQHLFEDSGMFPPEIDTLYAKIDHELDRLVDRES